MGHHKQKHHAAPTTTQAPSAEVEHEPAGAQIARYTSQGPHPAPMAGFGTAAVKSASERAYEQQHAHTGVADQDAKMDAAAQSVAAPLPKVDAGKGTKVDTEHAPSVGDVFDPERPALDDASQSTVLAIIQQNVNDLYQTIFIGQLAILKGDLSKTPPPPETPFAMKLLGWVVENIASFAIGYIGSFLGKELFGHEAAPKAEEAPVAFGGTEAEPIMATPKAEAPAAPAWKEKAEKLTEKGTNLAKKKGPEKLKEKMLERPTQEPSKEEETPSLTTGTLLDEFVTREQHMLIAKKSDILARLMVMHDRASGKAKIDTVELQSKLRDLIGSPALTAWFRNKVAMEWINFVARVSLGPRAKDQTTDLIGANAINGINEGGVEAQRQWSGADGMVEIHLDVSDKVFGTTGVNLRGASIPSSYGAGQILQRLQGYNLATMPVYRRVWLSTGESKLDASPALVITPDGQLEVDVSNPVLAAIGSGTLTSVAETVHMAGGTRMSDEDRQNPDVWANRTITAMQCNKGAHLVQHMLSYSSPEVIK